MEPTPQDDAAPIIERPSEKAAWPKTEEELTDYVREMIAWPTRSSNMDEGYGRCVYAIAYAAIATFNYVASAIGATGWQASCADLEVLTQTRHLEHGFMLLDASRLLYPQYDLAREVQEWIARQRVALAPAARALLAKGQDGHPDVRAHWERMAAGGTD